MYYQYYTEKISLLLSRIQGIRMNINPFNQYLSQSFSLTNKQNPNLDIYLSVTHLLQVLKITVYKNKHTEYYEWILNLHIHNWKQYMYQGYFFPLSHYNSHTLYYMYINSKSGCNRCPKCEILKARKQKKEKQRKRNG